MKKLLLTFVISVSALAGVHEGPGLGLDKPEAVVIEAQAAVSVRFKVGKELLQQTIRRVRTLQDGHFEFPIRNSAQAHAVAEFVNAGAYPISLGDDVLVLGKAGDAAINLAAYNAFAEKVSFVGRQTVFAGNGVEFYSEAPASYTAKLVVGATRYDVNIPALFTALKGLLHLGKMGALRERMAKGHPSQQVLLKRLVEPLKKAEVFYVDAINSLRRGRGLMKSDVTKGLVLVCLRPDQKGLAEAQGIVRSILGDATALNMAIDSALRIPANADITQALQQKP
ncbi:hypothetical protein K2X33_10885 [bacterium]|nr:hypothetical protein [bacterium]